MTGDAPSSDAETININPTPMPNPPDLPFHRSQAPAYLLPFLSALVALGPLTIDTYLPALPLIAANFGVDVPHISASVSTYLLGYAIGQFFGGPLSDQIGRKRIAVVGLTIFVLASLGILAAVTVEQFLVLRLLQAIGGGFSTVIAMAMVRDLYPSHEVGRRFAMIAMVMMVAPMLAPALGTALLAFGWHSIFWMFVAYGALLVSILSTAIPETLAKPQPRISLPSIVSQYRDTLVTRMRGGQLAVQFPLAMAFSGGVMMIFITQSAVIYLQHFAVGERLFSLLFGANVALLIASNFASSRLLRTVNPQVLFRIGLTVQLSCVALLFIVVTLTAAPLSLVVPLMMGSIGSIGLINPAGMTLYMSSFAKTGGSAAALFTTMMFSLGGVLGSLPNLFDHAGLAPIIGVMLLASSLANLIGQTARPVSLQGEEPLAENSGTA